MKETTENEKTHPARRVALTSEEIVADLIRFNNVKVQPPYSEAVEVRVNMLTCTDKGCAHHEAGGYFSCEQPVILLRDLEVLLRSSGCNYDCENCRE